MDLRVYRYIRRELQSRRAACDLCLSAKTRYSTIFEFQGGHETSDFEGGNETSDFEGGNEISVFEGGNETSDFERGNDILTANGPTS